MGKESNQFRMCCQGAGVYRLLLWLNPAGDPWERECRISFSVISSEGQVAGIFILQILSITGGGTGPKGALALGYFWPSQTKVKTKAISRELLNACRRMLIVHTGPGSADSMGGAPAYLQQCLRVQG